MFWILTLGIGSSIRPCCMVGIKPHKRLGLAADMDSISATVSVLDQKTTSNEMYTRMVGPVSKLSQQMLKVNRLV